MKVAYVCMQFPAPAETFAATDIRMLREQGVEVEVFALRPAPPAAAETLAARGLAGLAVRQAGLRETLRGLLGMACQPLLTLRALCWLLRHDISRPGHCLRVLLLLPACFFVLAALRRRRPDIVHLFWGHYPSMLGWLVRRELPGVRLSMFLGAYDLACTLGISASLARQADHVFTHAHANLVQLEALGIDVTRVTVVHRGVDVRLLGRLTQGCTRQPGRWICAGRMLPSKGFERVIAAFAVASRQAGGPQQLVLVGDGPARATLEQQARALEIAGRVHFTGFLPHARVVREMAAAEVFLLFSSKEGERLPNVVKEAMFAGCLCMVCPTPGIDELIADGHTGIIVTDDAPGSAAARLAYLSPVQRAAIGQNAHAFIVRHFDAATSMQHYLDQWRRQDV